MQKLFCIVLDTKYSQTLSLYTFVSTLSVYDLHTIMLHVSGHKGSAWKNDTKHLCQFSCFNTNTCTDVKTYYNETTSRFAGNRLLYIPYLMQETLLLMLQSTAES